MKRIGWMVAAAALLAVPGHARVCTENAVSGNFEVSFEGAEFDGENTTFTYCVTAGEDKGVRALSNWMIGLAPDCIPADFIVDCSVDGDGECYYQEDDPNLGLTGVKFDEIEVERGETECYSLVLSGDWTQRIGDVDFGLKAGKDTSDGQICGPACCESALRVESTPGAAPYVDVVLVHRLETRIVTPVAYRVFDADKNLVRSWLDGPVVFELGTEYAWQGPIPAGESLTPGTYRLGVTILGMSGYFTLHQDFQVSE